MTAFQRMLHSTAPTATILIRLLVGWVFVSEGLQKFIFPDTLGAGRFAKIGIPWPDVMGPFVGTVEITCGALVLVGLLTRFAVLPLLCVIVVAIITTKGPQLMHDGMWAMLHDARTDFSMFLGLCFLLAVGAGPLSVDARLAPSE